MIFTDATIGRLTVHYIGYKQNGGALPLSKNEQGLKQEMKVRVFKSVIKPDRNFPIYVHGDRQLMEKGYDEAVGKHFYKIYFDVEV